MTIKNVVVPLQVDYLRAAKGTRNFHVSLEEHLRRA